VLIFSAPAFALLSDKIGRKRVMVIGGVAMAAFLFVYFPLVGTMSIALATVRTAHAAPGTILAVNAEGMTARAVVQPTLRFVGATP
jgi:MFS family permease